MRMTLCCLPIWVRPWFAHCTRTWETIYDADEGEGEEEKKKEDDLRETDTLKNLSMIVYLTGSSTKRTAQSHPISNPRYHVTTRFNPLPIPHSPISIRPH